MLIIRPIRESDYDALLVCAKESGHGFTSLPVDEDLLKSRIKNSIESFGFDAKSPGKESYLMVAEDSETGEIAGVTGIEAAIGLDTPFYTYHVSQQVHHSAKLNVHNTVNVLLFGNNYTGATEICTLFLREKFRQGFNGKLLSKCRFLMLAQFEEKFSDVVFAEMRGVSDSKGDSPFWQWLKEHFFSMDFTLADHMTGTGDKSFIAELMPKLPIYVNLLSEEAKDVIGKVHDKTQPALHLLKKEGFRYRNHIDIFDGGPTIECLRENIHSVKNSFVAEVEIGKASQRQNYIICNTDFKHFRTTVAEVGIEEKTQRVLISTDVAKALQVKSLDKVRLVKIDSQALPH